MVSGAHGRKRLICRASPSSTWSCCGLRYFLIDSLRFRLALGARPSQTKGSPEGIASPWTLVSVQAYSVFASYDLMAAGHVTSLQPHLSSEL